MVSGPETVLFCDVKMKADGGYHARRVKVAGVMFILVISFLGLAFLLSRFMPGHYSAVLAGGVVLAGLIAWVILKRSGGPPKETILAAMRPLDSSARVRCHGKPVFIGRILAREPIGDTMFEPCVFRGTGATPATGQRKVVSFAAGILLGVGLIYAQIHYWHRVQGAYLDVLLAIGAGIAVGAWVFPTYLRVVPGRIDIMECGLLGRRILSVDRIDLRSQPVVVDLNRQVVRIGPDPTPRTIAFGAVWDNWGFAHAVLMGAVSTATPPPLPDDALVG